MTKVYQLRLWEEPEEINPSGDKRRRAKTGGVKKKNGASPREGSPSPGGREPSYTING